MFLELGHFPRIICMLNYKPSVKTLKVNNIFAGVLYEVLTHYKSMQKTDVSRL